MPSAGVTVIVTDVPATIGPASGSEVMFSPVKVKVYFTGTASATITLICALWPPVLASPSTNVKVPANTYSPAVFPSYAGVPPSQVTDRFLVVSSSRVTSTVVGSPTADSSVP